MEIFIAINRPLVLTPKQGMFISREGDRVGRGFGVVTQGSPLCQLFVQGRQYGFFPVYFG